MWSEARLFCPLVEPPMPDSPFALLDPESVTESPPARTLSTPRAAVLLHLVVATIMLALATLALLTGEIVTAALAVAMASMVVVAGWAVGRIAARRWSGGRVETD